MKYTIREMEALSLIGQEIQLTKSKSQNIKICTQFWQQFNTNLKKAYLFQSGNWVKYAFMEKRGEQLFYFCAIPRKVVVPDGFLMKEIPSQQYLVVEHIGAMDNIYDTYGKLYQELLPGTGYTLRKKDFLHFERYDYKFQWNRSNSVIEIWVPIETIPVMV